MWWVVELVASNLYLFWLVQSSTWYCSCFCVNSQIPWMGAGMGLVSRGGAYNTSFDTKLAPWNHCLLFLKVVYCNSCHKHVIIDGLSKDDKRGEDGENQTNQSLVPAPRCVTATPSTPSPHTYQHNHTFTGHSSRKKKRYNDYCHPGWLCSNSYSSVMWTLYSCNYYVSSFSLFSSASGLKAALHYSQQLKLNQEHQAGTSPKLANFLTSCAN